MGISKSKFSKIPKNPKNPKISGLVIFRASAIFGPQKRVRFWQFGVFLQKTLKFEIFLSYGKNYLFFLWLGAYPNFTFNRIFPDVRSLLRSYYRVCWWMLILIIIHSPSLRNHNRYTVKPSQGFRNGRKHTGVNSHVCYSSWTLPMTVHVDEHLCWA